MLLEAFQGRQADRIARVVAEYAPMSGASLVCPAQPLPEVGQPPVQIGMGLEPEGGDRCDFTSGSRKGKSPPGGHP